MKRKKQNRQSELEKLSEALQDDMDFDPEEIDDADDEDFSPEEPPKRMKKWKVVLLSYLLSLLGIVVGVVLAVLLYADNLLDHITPYDTANDVTLSSSEAEEIILNDPEAFEVAPDDDEDIPDIEDLTFPDELPVEQTQGQENQEQNGESTQGTNTGSVQAQDTVSTVNQDHVVNIMLVGQDRRPGEGRQRSDSMILVTFNKVKKTITLTSFMRDSYVRIPGYKPNKLNATYAFGGMKLLNQTLEQNFGVHVDGNVEVDFNSFEELIDLLGGVDIKLTEKDADYLNKAYGWSKTERKLSTGTNRLDGPQALAYSRIRKIDSDYRRTERQRKVISSLIQRYKSNSVGKMLDLLEDILPLVVTNMDKGEIVDYVMELTPMLSGASIKTLQIPAEGTFRQGKVRVRSGLAAWFQYDIDFNANRRLLNEVFAD